VENLAKKLQVSAAFHGLEHGDLVGIFEVRAYGNADSDSGDADAERLQQFGKVHGGGFAFGGGIRRHDDFFDGSFLQALDEGLNFQLLRAAPLQRRKGSAQHVIHAAIHPSLFNRENVVGFLNDADRPMVPRRADAIQTRIGVGDVVASGALADFFFGVANRIGKREGVFGRGAKQIKREALRGLLADSRKMFQCVNESFNRSGKIRHA
jgi:hypothetical protein